jgi:hypothetical protein
VVLIWGNKRLCQPVLPAEPTRGIGVGEEEQVTSHSGELVGGRRCGSAPSGRRPLGVDGWDRPAAGSMTETGRNRWPWDTAVPEVVGQRERPGPQLLVDQPGRVVGSEMSCPSIQRDRPVSSAVAASWSK